MIKRSLKKSIILLTLILAGCSSLDLGEKDHSVLIWELGNNNKISNKVFDRNEITVNAWIQIDKKHCRPNHIQTIVSKWQMNDKWGNFEAYDAGFTDGLDSKGFMGAIFDGRYIYFSPQRNTTERHGIVLRYDSHQDFSKESSWDAFDASIVDGLITKGFYGGVFDGTYVYFTPRKDNYGYHTRILRYDTRKNFKDRSAWNAFDLGLDNSYQGAAFDGKYAYFAPGRDFVGKYPTPALRYDTTKTFKDQKSYEWFNLGSVKKLVEKAKRVDLDGISFDGRYMYYSPLGGKHIIRYDTSKDFKKESSWEYYSPEHQNRTVGSTFDGRYVYFPGYNPHYIIRYDTTKKFSDQKSWKNFNPKETGAEWAGYDGAFFDGKYIYCIPFVDFNPPWGGQMVFHSILMRYDTTKNFSDLNSWSNYDFSYTSGMETIGYNAGVYDGRFLYFSPWHDGKQYVKDRIIIGHGKVTRYDTVGNNGTFILKFTDCGHNGGLYGAVPGPTFSVNTDQGIRSATIYKVMKPGKYMLTGTYDGEKIAIYINGELASKKEANGRIIQNNTPVTAGNIFQGNAKFSGKIYDIKIFNGAKSRDWIEDEYYYGQ